MTVSVRLITAGDIDKCVLIHVSTFQGFFLTFLGPAFLRELYVATLKDPSGIGFVADSEIGVCGFVTGTAQPSNFYRRLLYRHWWRFALAAMPSFLRRPFIASRLLRAFLMPNQANQQEWRGTLMSIAVLPNTQRKGIGKALVLAFLAEATRRGLRQVDLTTDRDNNEATNRFYQQLGFECVRTFTTPEGRAMNEYVINLRCAGVE